MIESININRTVPITNLVRARYSSAKIALPVRQNQYLYARFKHVLGVPANRENYGFSLDKLRNLDLLIERLSKLKMSTFRKVNAQGLSNEALDAMIDKYQMELHSLVAQRSSVNYGIPAGTGILENGVMLNMLV